MLLHFGWSIALFLICCNGIQIAPEQWPWKRLRDAHQKVSSKKSFGSAFKLAVTKVRALLRGHQCRDLRIMAY